MDINLIYQLMPLVVGTSMLAHPELSGDALRRQIDGDLRHATRAALGPAGFLADFLWSYAPVHDQIGVAIAREVAKVEAQRQNLGGPGSDTNQRGSDTDQTGSDTGQSGTNQQALPTSDPQEQGEGGARQSPVAQDTVAQDTVAGVVSLTAEESRVPAPPSLMPRPTFLLPPLHPQPPDGSPETLPTTTDVPPASPTL